MKIWQVVADFTGGLIDEIRFGVTQPCNPSRAYNAGFTCGQFLTGGF